MAVVKDSDLVEDPAYPGQTVQDRRMDVYLDAQIEADGEEDVEGPKHHAAIEAYGKLKPVDQVYVSSNLERRRARVRAKAQLADPDYPAWQGREAEEKLAENWVKPTDLGPTVEDPEHRHNPAAPDREDEVTLNGDDPTDDVTPDGDPR